MRRYTDNELGGYALVADGPMELVEEAIRAVKHDTREQAADLSRSDWTGRYFSNWEELRASFGKPWSEGLATITDFVEQLGRDQVEAPVSRRRRARFSELDGDVEVDRVLAREPSFYREMHRSPCQAPTNVSLVCNLSGLADVEPQDMFWRSASAAAIVDQLEAAGYSCEVVVWGLARCVFSDRDDLKINRVFTTYRLKECGEPLDLDTMACGLSAWFFRTVILNTRYGWPKRVKPRGIGYSVMALGEWRKYLDASQGVQVIEMPVVTTREAALDAARQILASVNQPVSF